MEILRSKLRFLMVVLIIGGIIWSIISIIRSLVKCIYNLLTKTIKIRKKTKEIVSVVVKDKKYYEGNNSLKPGLTGRPPVYELIFDYEDNQYIIATNKNVYNNHEINDSIDLSLTKYLDYKGDVVSENSKVCKKF